MIKLYETAQNYLEELAQEGMIDEKVLDFANHSLDFKERIECLIKYYFGQSNVEAFIEDFENGELY